MDDLDTIRSAGGVPFTVAREHADRFRALIDGLEKAGVSLDRDQSGGYNPRNIRGTQTTSQHASGRAIDVNWADNPLGSSAPAPPLPYDLYGEAVRAPTPVIHPEIARDLASRNGMRWGGDWRRPDPMHFEVAPDGGTPIASRGITSVAGLPAPPGPSRTPFTAAPGVSERVAQAAVTPLSPAPVAAEPTKKPPFEALPFKPAGAGDDGVAKAHAEAQKTALDWYGRRKRGATGLSSLNDQLFGAANG